MTDETVAAALTAHADRRRAEPHGLRPDADHLAGLLHGLLRQCQQAEPGFGLVSVARVPPPRANVRPTYDLDIVQRSPAGTETHSGVVIVTAQNATAVTAVLRRLRDDPRPFDRLVLVTDARVGLRLGTRGGEYLADLQQQGPNRFRHIEIPFEELIALDALRAVEGQARSGELEADLDGVARSIPAPEVIASHRRQGRYLTSELLRALLTPIVPAEEAAGSELNGTPSPSTISSASSR